MQREAGQVEVGDIERLVRPDGVGGATTATAEVDAAAHAIRLLADGKPTPFFLFDRQALRRSYREFRRLFPNASVYYAMKANSHPDVLRTLADEGCCFEAASVHELHLLGELAIAPDRILYGSAVKPASHIAEFAGYGVRHFAADSAAELEKLVAIVPGAYVFVRAKVDDADSQFAFSEKFGAELIDIVPLFLRATHLKLRPVGISFHVGSQSRNPRSWAEAIRGLRSVLSDLADHGIRLEDLNLGGGFPCAYVPGECRPLEEIAVLIWPSR